MGTRSLIRIYDHDETEIATIYTHTDGYPNGWMLEVARFLASRRFVKGIMHYDTINGIGDLVAQVITLLKLKFYESVKDIALLQNKPSDEVHGMILAGCIYAMPPGTEDVLEEWEYRIKPDENFRKLLDLPTPMNLHANVIIEVYKVEDNNRELVWKGTPQEYLEKFG